VRVELEQKHTDILRRLVDQSVTSFTLKGDRYGATQSLLILLELTLEYLKAAQEIEVASTEYYCCTFTWSGPSGVLGCAGQRRLAPLYGGVQPNTLDGRRLSRCAIERR
jgi:hypothetical protein